MLRQWHGTHLRLEHIHILLHAICCTEQRRTHPRENLARKMTHWGQTFKRWIKYACSLLSTQRFTSKYETTFLFPIHCQTSHKKVRLGFCQIDDFWFTITCRSHLDWHVHTLINLKSQAVHFSLINYHLIWEASVVVCQGLKGGARILWKGKKRMKCYRGWTRNKKVKNLLATWFQKKNKFNFLWSEIFLLLIYDFGIQT